LVAPLIVAAAGAQDTNLLDEAGKPQATRCGQQKSPASLPGFLNS
jgi:hypothetical protein